MVDWYRRVIEEKERHLQRSGLVRDRLNSHAYLTFCNGIRRWGFFLMGLANEAQPTMVDGLKSGGVYLLVDTLVWEG